MAVGADKIRIQISLKKDVLRDLDEMSKNLGISKSALVAVLIDKNKKSK